jgi:hypothetical protein
LSQLTTARPLTTVLAFSEHERADGGLAAKSRRGNELGRGEGGGKVENRLTKVIEGNRDGSEFLQAARRRSEWIYRFMATGMLVRTLPTSRRIGQSRRAGNPSAATVPNGTGDVPRNRIVACVLLRSRWWRKAINPLRAPVSSNVRKVGTITGSLQMTMPARWHSQTTTSADGPSGA